MPARLVCKHKREQANRQALIVDHLYVVRRIANRIASKLPPSTDMNDLVGAGAVGLIDAARKFKPETGVPFRSYAAHRIRGAILDSLRQLDPLSRDLRRTERRAQQAYARLCSELGRSPTSEEIARCLHLNANRWSSASRQLYAAGCPIDGDGFRRKPPPLIENLKACYAEPEQLAAHGELHRILDQAIGALPPRYQQVIRLYYDRAWTMKAIGRALGVNESRISQMHAWALLRLRRQLGSCSSSGTFV